MQHLFNEHEPLVSSLMSYVEVAAALAWQYGSRPMTPATELDLRSAFEAHWRELLRVDIDESVFHHARALAWEKRLRGADAIHLAAADSLRGRLAAQSVTLTLLTSDAEMAVAARSLGVETENPSDRG
jgi:predicted nucleic acid-binding protein